MVLYGYKVAIPAGYFFFSLSVSLQTDRYLDHRYPYIYIYIYIRVFPGN